MQLHLYPESPLITAAVLVPNLVFLAFPPKNVAKYGKAEDSALFTIIERVGQVSAFVLPLLFPLSFSGAWTLVAWLAMGILLVSYYALWVRFFAGNRDYALLFRPALGAPAPMAIAPVLYFLLSSLVLGSVWQAIAASILGVGHVTTTIREARRLEALDAGSRVSRGQT